MRPVRYVQALSVAGAALVLACAALASSAGATTASGTDPRLDNGPGFDARGDVTAFSIDYGATTTVSATTATFDDPETSPSWVVGLTGIIFKIDRNNDGVADDDLEYINNQSGGVDAGVENPAGHLLCVATPSFDAAANSYSASFPASCIGSPPGVAMSVMFDYESATARSEDLTAFTAPATGTSETTTSTTTSTTPSTTTSTTGPATTTTTFIAVAPAAPPSPSTTVAAEAPTTTTMAAAATDGTLPRTGGSEVPLILIALCMIGAGAGLASQRRKR